MNWIGFEGHAVKVKVAIKVKYVSDLSQWAETSTIYTVSYRIDVEDAGCEASKPSSLWNISVQDSNQFWHTLLFPVLVISHLKLE